MVSDNQRFSKKGGLQHGNGWCVETRSSHFGLHPSAVFLQWERVPRRLAANGFANFRMYGSPTDFLLNWNGVESETFSATFAEKSIRSQMHWISLQMWLKFHRAHDSLSRAAVVFLLTPFACTKALIMFLFWVHYRKQCTKDFRSYRLSKPNSDVNCFSKKMLPAHSLYGLRLEVEDGFFSNKYKVTRIVRVNLTIESWAKFLRRTTSLSGRGKTNE